MRRSGFTLTELLIVIAILAVMAVIAVPVISSIRTKAGLTADKTTAQSIEASIDMWMHTDYYDEAFFRQNLFSTASSGEAATGRIGGRTEQVYSYMYAGTDQLPGIELANERQIRQSVITAIKATSNMKIVERDGEQFVEPPSAGASYGFKYYYKIGRVNTELRESKVSALGNDNIYQYYVWLDQTGGKTGGAVTPKNAKHTAYLYVANEPLYSFTFQYGSANRTDMRIEIEEKGKQSYTFDAVNETAAMFKKGIYNIYCYKNGDLYSTVLDVSLNSQGQKIVFN